jgi:hypothetical protein
MAAFLELRRNADQILVELEHLAKYYFHFTLNLHLP